MTVIIKRSATRKEIKEAFKKVENAKNAIKGKGNISHLFGSNPNEVDGLEFQKKARNEWQ